jgi:hypothetical protein
MNSAFYLQVQKDKESARPLGMLSCSMEINIDGLQPPLKDDH